MFRMYGMPFLQEQKTARVAAKIAPLCVACMDAGKEREQDAVSFARRLFGTTTKTPGAFLRVNPGGVKHKDMLSKLLSSHLAYRDIGNERKLGAVSVDWHYFSRNSGCSISVDRP